MARPSRKAVLGNGSATVHVVARIHNKQFLLAEDVIKMKLLFMLYFYKFVFGILIYHYCILDNHFHIILHVPSSGELSKYMQRIFSQMARVINKYYGRCGQVFMDRARSPVIQDGKRFTYTMRYLDKNPVRAGIVVKAKDYLWSSYRYYAYGDPSDIIDTAPEYLGLARVPALRRKIYQKMINGLQSRGEERLLQMTGWYCIGDPIWVMNRMRCLGLIKPRKPPNVFIH